MVTWFDIPGFPNYMIDVEGVVKNIKTGRDLTPLDNGKGYMQVRLYNGGRGYNKSVRLLLELARESRIKQFQAVEEDFYGDVDIW